MKLPRNMVDFLAARCRRHPIERPPDFEVGDGYLGRWFIIPRNRWFNVYLHRFTGSDDDRALHDHPWWSLSIMLAGALDEHTIAAEVRHSVAR